MIHYLYTVRLYSRANLSLPTHGIDSGHGSQVRDRNGDEVDGYDEGNSNELPSGYAWPDVMAVIFPLDYSQAGMIIDDVRIFHFSPLTKMLTF